MDVGLKALAGAKRRRRKYTHESWREEKVSLCRKPL
jgi:hypothetical protein